MLTSRPWLSGCASSDSSLIIWLLTNYWTEDFNWKGSSILESESWMALLWAKIFRRDISSIKLLASSKFLCDDWCSLDMYEHLKSRNIEVFLIDEANFLSEKDT